MDEAAAFGVSLQLISRSTRQWLLPCVYRTLYVSLKRSALSQSGKARFDLWLHLVKETHDPRRAFVEHIVFSGMTDSDAIQRVDKAHARIPWNLHTVTFHELLDEAVLNSALLNPTALVSTLGHYWHNIFDYCMSQVNLRNGQESSLADVRLCMAAHQLSLCDFIYNKHKLWESLEPAIAPDSTIRPLRIRLSVCVSRDKMQTLAYATKTLLRCDPRICVIIELQLGPAPHGLASRQNIWEALRADTTVREQAHRVSIVDPPSWRVDSDGLPLSFIRCLNFWSAGVLLNDVPAVT